jgi:F-type H+-transporting ATPase subunit delta
MSDPRIEGYARGLFEIARAEGNLDEVEDELFRFGRSLETNEQLRSTLSNELVPADRRQAIVEDLLGTRATRTTTQLVSFIVGLGRSAELPEIIDSLITRAAGLRDEVVAEVRTAIKLTPDQETRLAAALANATGKNVSLKPIVDPSVLGGVLATVGDTVIDGSVRTRLEQLKSRL